MNIDDIVTTALREKEREMEAQLNELRVFIQSHLSKSGRTTKTESLPTSVAPTKRKYNAANRRGKRAGGSAIDTVVEKMKAEGRFLHRMEISKLTGIDPIKLSTILSVGAKNGKHNLINFVPGKSKNQTVWGFSDWMDDLDNLPKTERMYNKEFVMSRK